MLASWKLDLMARPCHPKEPAPMNAALTGLSCNRYRQAPGLQSLSELSLCPEQDGRHASNLYGLRVDSYLWILLAH